MEVRIRKHVSSGLFVIDEKVTDAGHWITWSASFRELRNALLFVHKTASVLSTHSYTVISSCRRNKKHASIN